MSSREPRVQPPESASLLVKDDKLVTQERKYELITPLFGGGVRAGVNDDITPISGKAVRGQLRFWWRATRGGQFGSGDVGLKAMKQAEDLIWGAASSRGKAAASAVRIEVVLGPYYKIGTSETPYERRHRANPDWADRIYAAFPLQDDPQSVTKYRFDLRISFPEILTGAGGNQLNLQTEIDAALWAWQIFGGIGARTRRGFGALKRTDDPESRSKDHEKIEQQIRSGLSNFVSDGEFPEGVPHLARDMSFVLATTEREVQVGPKKIKRPEPYKSAEDAWVALIVELKSFRQARSGRTGFGRSKWNEPERIREITNQRLPAHGRITDLASIESFPRAAFGQPIIFQFHRDQKNPAGSSDANRDPVDTILKGGAITGQPQKTRERLASPLILRPLACAGNKAVGLAAILRTARVPPEGLFLRGEGVNQKLDLRITKKDAMKIEPLRSFASRLPTDHSEVDVLEAFVDRFRR